MPVHHTSDSESLLLRTPAASEAERGHQPEEKARARGGQVTLSGQFKNLPTPTVADTFTDKLKSSQQKEGSMHSVNLSQAVHMLPTPNTMDDLPPRDESKIDRSKGGFSNVRETVVRPNFDRFEPVVKRWEETINLPAPAPTKPDGKDGAQRLSSEFTEWMMGLQPGWVTGHGLSRRDELKACGNGVVPQQAELALEIMLNGRVLDSSSKPALLSTPTTMDAKASNTVDVVEKFLNQGRQTCLTYEITNLRKEGQKSV
jgi:hypothetical protein